MRLLNNQIDKLALLRFCALLLVLVAGVQALGAMAQTTPGTAAQQPLPAETQRPLDVERDPVVSPDAADNAAVKPGAGTDAAAAAQKSDDISKTDGRFTLRRDVQEVVLNATVLDDQGHLVNDLTKDDFHIFEDGVPQTVASFQHTDVPVSMGILVDNSGSMREKRGAVNTAALDMVRVICR